MTTVALAVFAAALYSILNFVGALALSHWLLARRRKRVLEKLGLNPNSARLFILLSEISVNESHGCDGLPHTYRGFAASLDEYTAAVELRDLVMAETARQWWWRLIPQPRLLTRERGFEVIIRCSSDGQVFERDDAVVAVGSDVYNWFTHRMYTEGHSHLSTRLVDRDSGAFIDAKDILQSGLEEQRLPQEWFTVQAPRARRIQIGDGKPDEAVWTRELSEAPNRLRDVAIVEALKLPDSGRLPQSALLISGLGGPGTSRATQFVVDHVSAELNESTVQRMTGSGVKRKNKSKDHWKLILAWHIKGPPPSYEAQVTSSVGVIWPETYYSATGTERPKGTPYRLRPLVSQTNTDAFAVSDRPAFFFDFDGVLSEIVEEPSAAVPIPGTVELLTDLLEYPADVYILSSRPVEFLLAHFSADAHPELRDLRMIGSKGLASYENGQHHVPERVAEYVDSANQIVNDGNATIDTMKIEGIEIESKGMSVAIHYRSNESAQEFAEKLARNLAERHDFTCVEGRMVYELEPDLTVSKGTAIGERMSSYDWLFFAGDDVGDLPGFRVLGDRRSPGQMIMRVGVESDEQPAELKRLTDTQVKGPTGLQQLVRSLLEDARL